MECNCNEFLLASKIDVIKLKFNPVPEQYQHYLENPEKFGKVQNLRRSLNITRYNGQVYTKYDTFLSLCYQDVNIGAEEFYICQMCSKVYWIGSHHDRMMGGKYQDLLNLFPEAESACSKATV